MEEYQDHRDILNIGRQVWTTAKEWTQQQEETAPPPEQTKRTSIPYVQPTILYGPPGTGKTYSTRKRTLQIIHPGEHIAGWSDKRQAERFRELQAAGRVEFVTFHQSYGYEEFIEGIRPVLGGR